MRGLLLIRKCRKSESVLGEKRLEHAEKGVDFVEVSEEEITKLVPRGGYCYDENGHCPFLHTIEAFPRQINGYCSLIKKGDWEGASELWDSCKNCGINDEIESK